MTGVFEAPKGAYGSMPMDSTPASEDYGRPSGSRPLNLSNPTMDSVKGAALMPESILVQLQSQVQQQQVLLGQQQRELLQLSCHMRTRQQELDSAQAQLAERRADLVTREAAVTVREQQVEATAQALAAREKAVKGGEERLQALQQQVLAQYHTLMAIHGGLEARLLQAREEARALQSGGAHAAAGTASTVPHAMQQQQAVGDAVIMAAPAGSKWEEEARDLGADAHLLPPHLRPLGYDRQQQESPNVPTAAVAALHGAVAHASRQQEQQQESVLHAPAPTPPQHQPGVNDHGQQPAPAPPPMARARSPAPNMAPTSPFHASSMAWHQAAAAASVIQPHIAEGAQGNHDSNGEQQRLPPHEHEGSSQQHGPATAWPVKPAQEPAPAQAAGLQQPACAQQQNGGCRATAGTSPIFPALGLFGQGWPGPPGQQDLAAGAGFTGAAFWQQPFSNVVGTVETVGQAPGGVRVPLAASMVAIPSRGGAGGGNAMFGWSRSGGDGAVPVGAGGGGGPPHGPPNAAMGGGNDALERPWHLMSKAECKAANKRYKQQQQEAALQGQVKKKKNRKARLKQRQQADLLQEQAQDGAEGSSGKKERNNKDGAKGNKEERRAKKQALALQQQQPVSQAAQQQEQRQSSDPQLSKSHQAAEHEEVQQRQASACHKGPLQQPEGGQSWDPQQPSVARERQQQQQQRQEQASVPWEQLQQQAAKVAAAAVPRNPHAQAFGQQTTTMQPPAFAQPTTGSGAHALGRQAVQQPGPQVHSAPPSASNSHQHGYVPAAGSTQTSQTSGHHTDTSDTDGTGGFRRGNRHMFMPTVRPRPAHPPPPADDDFAWAVPPQQQFFARTSSTSSAAAAPARQQLQSTGASDSSRGMAAPPRPQGAQGPQQRRILNSVLGPLPAFKLGAGPGGSARLPPSGAAAAPAAKPPAAGTAAAAAAPTPSRAPPASTPAAATSGRPPMPAAAAAPFGRPSLTSATTSSSGMSKMVPPAAASTAGSSGGKLPPPPPRGMHSNLFSSKRRKMASGTGQWPGAEAEDEDADEDLDGVVDLLRKEQAEQQLAGGQATLVPAGASSSGNWLAPAGASM